MAQFKDVLPSQHGWIHDLARAEVHPEAERLLQLGRSFDPQQLVEESTILFLNQLSEHFNECARVFNSYSESGAKFSEIKVYAVAQTAADFMVYRNQVRLLASNAAHGVIQISFNHYVRSTLAVDGQAHSGASTGRPAGAQSAELLAQVGPFRDVYWTYQGERVTAEQVARYFFAEFSRVTRDTRPSKSGNQLLLDQIKALLQEKGLDL